MRTSGRAGDDPAPGEMSMKTSGVGGQLTRIQLKWLLTLELSSAVKNPKRCAAFPTHPRGGASVVFFRAHLGGTLTVSRSGDPPASSALSRDIPLPSSSPRSPFSTRPTRADLRARDPPSPLSLRDFANGYLVAEILAHYFPSDVSMHSFDRNASSVHKKRDNWGLLVKIFKKHDMDIRTREWEAVCAAEDGAALALVEKLHHALAGGAHFQGATRDHHRDDDVDRSRRPRRSAHEAASPAEAARHSGDPPRHAPPRHHRSDDDRGARGASVAAPSTSELMARGGGAAAVSGRRARDDAEDAAAGRAVSTVDVAAGRLVEGEADEYVEPPRPFRFNPSSSGGFDWEAYQREYMSPGRDGGDGGGEAEDETVRGASRASRASRSSDEPEDLEFEPRGARQRAMRPLREGGGDALVGRDPGYDRDDAPPEYEGGFDPSASLLDWGPELPSDGFGYGGARGGGGGGGGGTHARGGGFDGYDGGGTQRMRIHSRAASASYEADAAPPDPDRGGARGRRRDPEEGHRGRRRDPPERGEGQGRRRDPTERGEGQGRRRLDEDSFSSFGGPGPSPGRGGFYNPSFYEKLYDRGEPRGILTYDNAGSGGYHRDDAYYVDDGPTRERSLDGPYAGAYGMDYEPKRAEDYRRCLGENGEYLKLGSLGVDVDTQAHREARERKEAIREMDRVVREQNRVAAERRRAARERSEKKTGAAGKASSSPPRLQKHAFRHHTGDVDPIKGPREPSKHDKMLAYAKRHVPKPVQAPPKKAPPKPPRAWGHWDEPVEDAFPRGPEWPHAWGGAPDVPGPHQSALGPSAKTTRRGMHLQPDATHDRGEKREMTELERLEMEHRVHQEKLKALRL